MFAETARFWDYTSNDEYPLLLQYVPSRAFKKIAVKEYSCDKVQLEYAFSEKAVNREMFAALALVSGALPSEL